MRLHISLSAVTHNFKKGDRVVCKIAKDEWYIGTVVRAGVKVKVDFDDDFDAIIDENDFKHIKLMTKDRKLKRSLTDIEAKALYEQKKTIKQAAQKPVAIPKPKLKIAPVSKKPFIAPKPLPPIITRPSAPKLIDPEIPKVPVVPIKRFIPQDVHKPVAPVELQSEWQVYLVPNDYRQWSYSVKDKPIGAKIFNASRYEYLHAVDALKAAFKHITVPVFTLHIAEEVIGNSISRSTVKDNLTKEEALVFTAKIAGTPTGQMSAPDEPPVSEETGENADKPYLQCGNAQLFKRAANGSDAEKINYMQYVWGKGQTLIFHRLVRPAIRFLKEQQAKSFRRRGHWHAARRELAMSRRVFNAGEDKFLEIFLHEMSHQAVTDIDHAIDTNKGHGPRWTAWMQKCGIPASRYDYTDATEYMDEEEKDAHNDRMETYKQQMENAGTKIPNTVPAGTPAKFYSPGEKRWYLGVTGGIFGTKMMFLHTVNVGKVGWKTLPNKGKDWLYAQAPGESPEDYNSPEWKAAVAFVELSSRMRLARRRTKPADEFDDTLRLLRNF